LPNYAHELYLEDEGKQWPGMQKEYRNQKQEKGGKRRREPRSEEERTARIKERLKQKEYQRQEKLAVQEEEAEGR
jgi:hypothetical protein